MLYMHKYSFTKVNHTMILRYPVLSEIRVPSIKIVVELGIFVYFMLTKTINSLITMIRDDLGIKLIN